MKYGIDIGHNCPPVDVGAVGIRREGELNKLVGVLVMGKLKALNHEVVYCTPSYASSSSNSLYQRVSKANSANVDFYVSIHFNAGGGRGTEVYAISKAAKEIAKRVVDAIAALGYVNRGVKDGSSLYVLKNTKMPAILVEGSFVDSREDMGKFNAEKIAAAIVKGLTGRSANEKVDIITSTNTALLKIQRELNILKILDFTGKRLIEDGIMGQKTASAIKKFQGITGLAMNGIADLKTNQALINILNKPLLQYGNRNSVANRYVQWRLNITVDGIFGDATKKAILAYQTAMKLIPDGIVGNITWTKLIG